MARRAHGEGTVYYDAARDRWIGAVRVDGRRRKVSGKDKTEARSKLAKLLAAKTTGTPADDRKMTVSKLLATFMEREIPNRASGGKPLAPRTIEMYRWSVKILTDEIGTIRTADLRVDDIEVMFDRLARRKKNPLSVASLRKIRSTLTAALEFGIRRRYLSRNVAQHATITGSTGPESTRTVLSPANARKLLAALRDERNGAMFALQLRVGLRPGEAAGLYWADLHDTALNVTRGVQMIRGHAHIADDLKTSAAKRTIELPAELVTWLADHRRQQLEERLAAESWIDERLMFASPTGNVLDPSNTRRLLAAICTRAKVPVMRPNELRHACASLLSDMGVANELIADLLGHTTTRMVERTYRHRLRPVVDIAAKVDWTASQ